MRTNTFRIAFLISVLINSNLHGLAGECCQTHVIAKSGSSAKLSGKWSDKATWGGTVPATNARVCIPTGITVTLDVDPPPLTGMVVEGTLRFTPRDTRLTAGWIMVHGLLEVGTAAAPFLNSATITLTGNNPSDNLTCTGMSMGTKFLTAMNGGKLVMHGPVDTSWTRLAKDVPAGATSITVDTAKGWKAGDVIAIASRVAVRGQTERRTITSVKGNALTLDKALSFPHSGTAPTFDQQKLDMRSEVGRLTRRIVIQGDAASAASRFGGHVMVMKGGMAQLDGVELVRLGQFNMLGRYPFHWHLLGDAPGQYVKNCSVHTSFQRGIVIHGTRRTLVQGNVVYDTPGHNFSVEDANTTDNSLLGNLALENTVQVFTEPTLSTQGDNQAANYWIRAAKNTFIGNVAAASMANGFWYDNVIDGPTTFRQNTGHSSYSLSVNTDFVRDSGLLVVNVGSTPLEFSDSLFYQNNIGVWPSETGLMKFSGIRFADHWQGPAMTMDTGGATVGFENCLFVGRTRPSGPGETPADVGLPPALLIQYSGQAALTNPTFVNYGQTGLLSANDIFVEWQAEYFLKGVKLIGTDPSAIAANDAVVTVVLDSSTGLAPGVYVSGSRPQLADTNSVPVAFNEEGLFLRNTKLPGYALLRTFTPDPAWFATPWHNSSLTMRRSDSLVYSDPNVDGFRIICGGAYQYEFRQAPTSPEFYLSLDDMGTPMPTNVSQTAIASIPLAKAPLRVAKIDTLDEDSVAAANNSKLVRAASRSQFDASPAKTYFYDFAAGKLWVQADAKYLVITK